MSEAEIKINKKHITKNQEYYKILELEEGATPEEVKKARDKLALKWHPDKFKQGKSPAKTEEEAIEMMQKISKAFEILYHGEVREDDDDSKEISEVGEKVVKWNAVKISKFVEWIKKKLNIQEQAVVQATASVQNEAKVEEKTGKVSIRIIEVGAEKIKVWKEIANIHKEEKGEIISPVRAKKLTEEGDKIILEDVPYDKVEGEKGIKKRLEDLGAKVQIEKK